MRRWAWHSGPVDPFVDASFRYTWNAGAIYIAYPGGVPSYRFLELRNGIVAAEKIRILKEKGLFKDEIARWRNATPMTASGVRARRTSSSSRRIL